MSSLLRNPPQAGKAYRIWDITIGTKCCIILSLMRAKLSIWMILTRIILHFHYNKTSAISNQQSTSISAISLYRRHLRSSPSVYSTEARNFYPKDFISQLSEDTWRLSSSVHSSSLPYTAVFSPFITLQRRTFPISLHVRHNRSYYNDDRQADCWFWLVGMVLYP